MLLCLTYIYLKKQCWVFMLEDHNIKFSIIYLLYVDWTARLSIKGLEAWHISVKSKANHNISITWHCYEIKCEKLKFWQKNDCWHVSTHDLLQQLVVGKAEGLLQQHWQHHSKDEKTFLLRSTLLVADLDWDEPNQRGQQQGHEPEKRSERQMKVVALWIVTITGLKSHPFRQRNYFNRRRLILGQELLGHMTKLQGKITHVLSVWLRYYAVVQYSDTRELY